MPVIHDNVPLAPRTTLGLGGPARHFVEATSDAEVVEALTWAEERRLPVHVLGGGSNLVVGDDGFPGLVIAIAMRGARFDPDGARIVLVASAGEPWDAVVAEAVRRDLAGLECLSGVPGLVGATPIQNVGAYGQEVCETILCVRALDRLTGNKVELAPDECAFGYRSSAFKSDPTRHVVLEVTFALTPNGEPSVRYAELARALDDDPRPSLARVRETVIALRRRKSMVLDPSDENGRSAGSFFTNPIVPDAVADDVVAQAVRGGLVSDPTDVPRYPASAGTSKLAAGWLIERAGIAKGTHMGRVGISTKHALALVHHGGGTTEELLVLARHVRATVQARFGVTLEPEPVMLGCAL